MNNQDISISGETFADVRNETDAMMGMLLDNMIEKNSAQAKLTISIDIDLRGESVDDGNEGFRVAYSPTFRHKISVAMQSKAEVKGDQSFLDMELVKVDDKWVLMPKTGAAQTTIYDMLEDKQGAVDVEVEEAE